MPWGVVGVCLGCRSTANEGDAAEAEQQSDSRPVQENDHYQHDETILLCEPVAIVGSEDGEGSKNYQSENGGAVEASPKSIRWSFLNLEIPVSDVHHDGSDERDKVKATKGDQPSRDIAITVPIEGDDADNQVGDSQSEWCDGSDGEENHDEKYYDELNNFEGTGPDISRVESQRVTESHSP